MSSPPPTPVQWNTAFQDWLKQYNTLYDPSTFIHTLTQAQINANVPQDITRFPVHEKGVSAVRLYNALNNNEKAKKYFSPDVLDFMKSITDNARTILKMNAKNTFYEIFRNAGVTNDAYIDPIWTAALVYRNGYTDHSTTVRW
jgi:hypothetical protein